MWLDWLAHILEFSRAYYLWLGLSFVLLAAGAIVLRRAARAWPTNLCGHCAYPLGNAPRCPECGLDKAPARRRRVRRRLWRAACALCLLILGSLCFLAHREASPIRLVPSELLVRFADLSGGGSGGGPPTPVELELDRRLASRELSHRQRSILARRCLDFVQKTTTLIDARGYWPNDRPYEVRIPGSRRLDLLSRFRLEWVFDDGLPLASSERHWFSAHFPASTRTIDRARLNNGRFECNLLVKDPRRSALGPPPSEEPLATARISVPVEFREPELAAPKAVTDVDLRTIANIDAKRTVSDPDAPIRQDWFEIRVERKPLAPGIEPCGVSLRLEVVCEGQVLRSHSSFDAHVSDWDQGGHRRNFLYFDLLQLKAAHPTRDWSKAFIRITGDPAGALDDYAHESYWAGEMQIRLEEIGA